MDAGAILFLSVFVILIVIVVLKAGVRFIKPYQKGIYIRLRVIVRVLDQGYNFVAPLIGRVVLIDLRSERRDVRPMPMTTADGRELICRILFYISVQDAMKAFTGATNYRTELDRIAAISAGRVIYGMSLEKALSSRGIIESETAESVRKAARDLGVRVDDLHVQVQGVGEVLCDKCGSSNPATNSFCGKCGGKIAVQHFEDAAGRGPARRADAGFSRPHAVKVAVAPDNSAAPYEVESGFGFRRKKDGT